MTKPSGSEPSARKCHCSGACGSPSYTTLSRREFIGLVGAGSAALLAGPAWAAFELPTDELEKWRRNLSAPAEPLRYFSGTHVDARMHLGGIGTGNFEIGSDGQLTTWQLFNTLKDGQVPFHFLVKAGSVTKLLQTAGGPDWPRVKRIEMTGEYPVASLRFEDPDLPVRLELRAFSPFAPLDSGFSAIPTVSFVFRVQNASDQDQTVSFAALMQNPVGYEAGGDNTDVTNPSFGGNINEVFREGNATGLFMRALEGRNPSVDQDVNIWTLANLKGLEAPPIDRPGRLQIHVLDEKQLPTARLPGPTDDLIWLEEPPSGISESFLQAVRTAVNDGATLLFSGNSLPLLQAYGSWTGGKAVAEASPRQDVVFEDFEHGYGNWKVEGAAFGKAPATGTWPGQQRVSGYLGQALVNSFLNGDDTVGRLTSKPFTIERRFIRFLVGGGNHERTQIRLLVDGKVVRATSGKRNERLEPAAWSVGDLQGKTAHIEIVDEQTGDWGHINVDQIEFSDLPGDRALMLVLEELLPARFSAIRPAAGEGRAEFQDFVLVPGAAQSTLADGRIQLVRPLGKGKVVVVAGAVLEPHLAGVTNCRQDAYGFLCGLLGAKFTPSGGLHPRAPGFGTLALAALAGNASALADVGDFRQLWATFADKGSVGSSSGSNSPTRIGRTVCGAVTTTVHVPASGSLEVPFLLTWHYPNKYASDDRGPKNIRMGCHYTTRWPDARAVMREASSDFAVHRERTELFRRTFYDSTLPYWLLDCLTANAAIGRHIGVVFRIENGDVYGWEDSNGCCDPTCTHVWGYEQSFARLFPELERDMRRIDFKHQQRPDGGVNNRTDVPSPPHPSGEKPFADGHASCILKAYREALNCPDESFFREYWPHVKRAVDYLSERDAKGAGGEPAGILQDDQWNTYDEALHGVTTFISGYYLAALRAGEAWARRQGDSATANRFREISERGQKKLIELCWNGEYFQQHLEDYAKRQGEVGPGCMADQLIGQWWAHQLGLGYILPKEQVVSSLRAIYKYNFKTDLTGWKHSPRAFAGAKDKGLIICTWPRGGRPAGVMLYSDEVWTGIEYQVAGHMIYEGLVEEGLSIVKAARERYDGIPRPPIGRNPWNEIECGGHYARAMSSWGLLLALSGWEYDGPRKNLRWTPRCTPENFKSFFAGPEAWGTLRQSRDRQAQTNEITVRQGRLPVGELSVVPASAPRTVEVDVSGRQLTTTFAIENGTVRISFKQPTVIEKGETLLIRLA